MTTRQDLENKIRRDMARIKENMAQDALAKNDPNKVPYDKEAARAVIEKFLTDHPDKVKFLTDLKKKMDD